MKKVQGIIMDWAGTAIDFGCFAPLHAFLKTFREWNVEITYAQAREPMGLLKIDHIRAILSMPEVSAKFQNVHGRPWTEDDAVKMNAVFEKYLFASLADFTTPIPGVTQTLDGLRKKGVKIGSTTGYTLAMMEIVRREAEKKGYRVDNTVTPDGLPAGRPAPYMIYRNMIDLALDSPDCVVKVGDTKADIREGLHAKVWSVGIITGSNELGLSEQQYKTLPTDELIGRKHAVREVMLAAGAHYVLDRIAELPACIEDIERRLNAHNQTV